MLFLILKIEEKMEENREQELEFARMDWMGIMFTKHEGC